MERNRQIVDLKYINCLLKHNDVDSNPLLHEKSLCAVCVASTVVSVEPGNESLKLRWMFIAASLDGTVNFSGLCIINTVIYQTM